MKLLSKIPLIMMAGGLLLIGIGIKSFLRSKDFVEHSSLADGQIIERSDVYGGSKLGPRVDVKASFQDKNGKSFILSFTHVTATKFALNSSVKIVYDPKEPGKWFYRFRSTDFQRFPRLSGFWSDAFLLRSIISIPFNGKYISGIYEETKNFCSLCHRRIFSELHRKHLALRNSHFLGGKTASLEFPVLKHEFFDSVVSVSLKKYDRLFWDQIPIFPEIF